MTLPSDCREARRAGSGAINEGWRVTLADGREAFVKTRVGARPGEYAAEAAALAWLADARALPTPAVLDASDEYLVLEWIETGPAGPLADETLGRGLARLHRAGAPSFGDPGRIAHMHVGPLMLPNDPAGDWPAFYATRRLEPLARAARDAGAISAQGARDVTAVCARLEDLCAPAEPPSRLHGDMWSGNVLFDSAGQLWLIDTCAYGGHREIDLAMLRLFGGPRERVIAAYEEEHPLAPGWRERAGVFELLPLLVHAILFGHHYGADVERTARRYAG